MIGLSLFSNIGIAEMGLDPEKFKILFANEVDKRRSTLYGKIHASTIMIHGDIRSSNIKTKLTENSEIDFIISSPPCQGMSTAGKNDKNDPRNNLVTHSIEIIKKLLPKYVFHENVPGQEKTFIEIKNTKITIPEYIELELSEFYNIEKKIILMSDYGVPQNRKRSIYLLSKKSFKKWYFPDKKGVVNLEEAIGSLPSLDPYVSDLKESEMLKIFPDFYKKINKGLSVSKYHTPVSHPLRQILVMMRTPTGSSAFENELELRPKKKDGEFVKGFKNTYKRLDWNKPSSTITTYNRTISSQENVHPGREYVYNGLKYYSDPRVFTLYELMVLMTIPKTFIFPENYNHSFIRSLIGEGIPPRFINDCFKMVPA